MHEDGNIKTWIWAFAAGFLLALPMLYFDYGESDHPELDQAVRAVRFLSSPNQIKRSSFWMIQEEKTPGRFVEWMFSPLGSAVWAPAGEATGLPPGAAKQARGAACSLWVSGCSPSSASAAGVAWTSRSPGGFESRRRARHARRRGLR